MRAVPGRVTDAKAAGSSTNWSGLETSGTFSGIAGAWTVPAVAVTSANHYSCTWVGLDGYTNKTLIQTGTEEDSVGGHTRYYAWLETLPAAQTDITFSNGSLVPVAPGDAMWSYIYRTTGNTWAIYLQDQTQGWTLNTTTTYSTPGANVEWIHEATNVGGVVGAPPAFSPVNFTTLEVLENGTWYYTGLKASSEVTLVQNGTVWATPGAPIGSNPQHFQITYK